MLALNGTYAALQEFDRATEVLPEQFTQMRALSTREWDLTLPSLRESLAGNVRQEQLLGTYLSGAVYLSMYAEIAALYDAEVQFPEKLSDSGLVYPLGYFALAMGVEGREDERQRILATMKKNYENQITQGIDSPEFLMDLARFHAVNDEFDKGIEYLETALSRGQVIADWSLEPELLILSGESRFAELKANNLAIINRERAKLGWSPVAHVRE